MLSPKRNNSEGSTHPKLVECHSRQAFQTQPADPDRLVPLSACVQSLVLEIVPATCRPVCNPLQPQTSKFVSPVQDQTAWAVDAMSLSWENLDVYAFHPVSLLNPVISKVMDRGCHRMILIPPGWPNMPWFWDLVNLSVQIPFKLPLQRDLVTQPFNGLVHKNLNNLASRISAIQEQGFSDKEATRIEAPQRHSTRAVYKSKWSIFVKWCETNEVDFRLSSVTQIAEFLLHLFKKRKLQPGSIEGYRTAIADLIGNDNLSISKDENLT